MEWEKLVILESYLCTFSTCMWLEISILVHAILVHATNVNQDGFGYIKAFHTTILNFTKYESIHNLLLAPENQMI